jgi:hypothetical protein
MKLVEMPPKEKKSVDGWSFVDEKLPPQVRELYIVIQDLDGQLVRNAAFFEQDANGEWGFNKPGITYWREWPAMPAKA